MADLPPLPEDAAADELPEVSLVELVDHVLNKGVVLVGEATIAVANIDLIYLGLSVVLASAETARQSGKVHLLPWPEWSKPGS
ncbi:MAG TPA: gas vesicle protein [Chloroflexota bacterium]|nr:gas vesicle protein [Chloroflexota bacterium]